MGWSNCSNSSACLGLLCALLIATSYLLFYHADDEAIHLFSEKWMRPLLNVFQGDDEDQPVSTAARIHSVNSCDFQLERRDEERLKGILEAVAFRNKTVILTTLNKSWADNNTMVDIFLESFRLGVGTSQLLDHLIIVNLDQAAQRRCEQVHPHCFSLPTPGIDFSSEKMFMSSDYLQMMWRRIDFLRRVLELGYNFVFTDADIMWLRDPFPHFEAAADFEIACDRFNGDSRSLHNFPNGGFVHAVSNKRTIAFYKYWYHSRVYHPNHHDQDVFNDIKFTPEFAALGLRYRLMDTKYFGGFCEPSRDFDEVCTMHANCCTKLERKLADLELVLDDWKRYSAMSPDERRSSRIFWRAPRECLHSWGH